MILMGLLQSSMADQWGSIVQSHCYDLDDPAYREHFFVRVFWTEIGGGQFHLKTPRPENPAKLYNLHRNPAKCTINGKIISFETLDYQQPTGRGGCGLCEQTGFQLTVDGKTVWHVEKPMKRGGPIFKGTIDMDRDMLRVCEENSPNKVGVEIPFKQDFFSARTSIMICKTIAY